MGGPVGQLLLSTLLAAPRTLQRAAGTQPASALPPATWRQAYEEFDEEVGEAEELEERALSGATAPAERDDEIKPYIHK